MPTMYQRTSQKLTRNALNDALLSHLQHLSREYDASFGEDFRAIKTIEQIYNAILASDKEYTDKYLMRVLAFLKLPQNMT